MGEQPSTGVLVGTWLCRAAIPTALLPILLPIIVLPIAKCFGFEVVGESGDVRYRGQRVTAASPRAVRVIADWLAPLGVLPWLMFYSVPLGFGMGTIGSMLQVAG